jgi:hypothetical protein
LCQYSVDISSLRTRNEYATNNKIDQADLLALATIIDTLYNGIYIIFNNDTNNPNINSLALSSGWNGSSASVFNIIVKSGKVIGSSSTSIYALDIPSFPNGSAVKLTIESGAYVVGCGGNGGNGSPSWGDGAFSVPPYPGYNGGPALKCRTATNIKNNGTIGGGGGGGSCSISGTWCCGGNPSYAGGGGAGRNVGLSGVNGWDGTKFNDGSLTTGGAGSTYYGSGSGGNLGQAGGKGRDANYTGASGGAAGVAVDGNSFITWTTQGTILGSII